MASLLLRSAETDADVDGTPLKDPEQRFAELTANCDQRRSGEPSRRVFCKRWISSKLKGPSRVPRQIIPRHVFLFSQHPDCLPYICHMTTSFVLMVTFFIGKVTQRFFAP